MCIELKIKSKHLALEPQIIRTEENKLKKQMKHHRAEVDGTSVFDLESKLDSLINHRRWNVRNEARATVLARTYLAGKPYAYAEQRSKDNDILFALYIVPRIVAMVARYGTRDQRNVTREIILEWANINKD